MCRYRKEKDMEKIFTTLKIIVYTEMIIIALLLTEMLIDVYLR